jgi:homoserine dehydrogenase
MHEIKLSFVGFGNVGRALAKLLLSKRAEIESSYDVSWRVVGLMTGSHGSAIDPEGIDLERALTLTHDGELLDALSAAPAPTDTLSFIRTCHADLMFENTPVSYQDGQPAVSYLRAAFEAGMHVATANKGPVVHAFSELNALASDRGRKFLFESTVMDGAPIFSLWRSSLPGAKLNSFRGILNSTTNLVLTMMESGSDYQDALSHAQEIGIAETDPSGDIEGWDAAVKVAALVTVLMEHPTRPDQVLRQGIESITLEQVEEASRNAQRWKLVCYAERTSASVKTEVRPELVDKHDPLYPVMGTSSAITFQTDVLGSLTVLEENPGPDTTAYGLLADMLNIVRPD